MSSPLPAPQPSDSGEFLHLDPSFIKVQEGSLGRRKLGNLEPLKNAIIWRERRRSGTGLLQPLLVSRIEQTPYYRLEDGLRRFSAVRALLREGFSIPTVPVRILPAPLTALERLALLFSEGKPLEALEEAEIIDKLLSQGLSEENLLQAFNRSWEELERRRSLLRLGKTLRQQIEEGDLAPQIIEGFWKDYPLENGRLPQQAVEDAKKNFECAPACPRTGETPMAESQTGARLGTASDKGLSPTWMGHIFEPGNYYISLGGLYEWMGAKQAQKHGYSRKVVGIVEVLLQYCGGKLSLTQTADALRKVK